MQHRNRPHISLTLDKTVIDAVKKLAEKRNRSVSLQIEKLVEQALLLNIDM